MSLHDHPFRYPAPLNTESWGQVRLQKRLVFAYNGMAGAGMGATVACTNSWQTRDETTLVLSRLRTDLSHHDGVYVAESVAEIRRRFAAGAPGQRPLGVIFGLESLTAFADDLNAVELLYAIGVRVAGLIYSEGNILGCGLAQTADTGLTAQGRAYVRRMNEVGMTIDLAHVGDQTTLDVIALSDRPVLISHAGARGLWPTSRMKSDEVVRALVDRGGVIGVEAAPNTTCSPKRATHNIDAVMDHVEYLIDLVGVDNVALGPDVIFGPHIEMHHFRSTGPKSTTLAGFYAGRMVDQVIMRLVDMMLGFPYLLLAMIIVAILGPSLLNAMIAVGVVNVPIYARLVRGSVLSTREREYVHACRVVGGSDLRIVLRHILPNVLTPVIVQATLGVGQAIINAAGLSFLGLGAQPPAAEWGAMLASGREYILRAPWVGAFPGMSIFVMVLGLNLMGDGLRDALDPKLK